MKELLQGGLGLVADVEVTVVFLNRPDRCTLARTCNCSKGCLLLGGVELQVVPVGLQLAKMAEEQPCAEMARSRSDFGKPVT